MSETVLVTEYVYVKNVRTYIYYCFVSPVVLLIIICSDGRQHRLYSSLSRASVLNEIVLAPAIPQGLHEEVRPPRSWNYCVLWCSRLFSYAPAL